MSIEVITNGLSEEVVIDLSNFDTLEEMKDQLQKSLAMMYQYEKNYHICIDVGIRRLTERQLRELETLVAKNGLCLKEWRNSENRNRYDRSRETIINPSTQYLESAETVMLCRHVRSGQKIFTQGNIVILGDVNPGAEIIAGGNILIMGALRGMAHAGAMGDEEAVIAAFRLNPTQLRIASHITRAPDGERLEVNNPEIARIRAGTVVIERLKI